MREELATIRRAIEAALEDRIAAAVAAGEMPAGTDPATLSAYVMAVVQGPSTLARDGAERDALLRVARHAMAAWPSSDR